jgi:hypothetical protein
MLFIYPMWDNESQRIGKQKCTPLGYRLHGIAEGLGFIGFFLIIAICAYLGYRRYTGSFKPSLFWLFALPLGMGIVGEFLYWLSWRLAFKRGFQYNYETREASWIENGQRLTYKYAVNPSNVYRPITKETTDAIRQVLLKEWDPIGVAECPEAQDEYDDYIGPIYHLLLDKQSAERIAYELNRIVVDKMGLPKSPNEKALRVARLLQEINIVGAINE